MRTPLARMLAVLGVMLILATPAFAACTSPAGVEGDVVYNDDYDAVQVCTGSNIWVKLGGATTDARIGTLTANKWCAANAGGTAIDCTQNAPGGTLSGGTAGYLGVWTGASSLGLSSTSAGQQLFWDTTTHRLGIGTTSPSAMLYINKTGAQANQTIASDTQSQILLTSPNNFLYFHDASAGADQKYMRLTSSAGITSFQAMKDSLASTQSVPITMLHSSGYVGIGTTSPAYTLDVAGNFQVQNADPYVIWNENDQGADAKRWDLYSGGGVLRLRAVNDAYNAANSAMEVTRSGYTISKVAFPNGNVGIGTTSPVGSLHVVQPSSGWAIFQGNTGAGGTTWVPGTDPLPLASSSGFIGYNGIALVPNRWGNATTADAHNVVYIGGAQRNSGATAATLAFANWGYFTGTGSGAGGLGNATAQGDAVKFGIALQENGGEFAQRLQFYGRSASGTTSNVMSILSNGNVGIGTTSPTLAKLETAGVVGATAAVFGSDTTGMSMIANYPGLGMNAYYNGGDKAIGAGYGGVWALDPTTGNLTWRVSTATAAAGAAFAGSNVRLSILQSGNVGIGTTSPLFKLIVVGADTTADPGNGVTGTFAVSNGTGISTDPKIEFGMHDTGTTGYGWIQALNTNSSFRDLALSPSGGKVGIGTTTPEVKLDVRGSLVLDGYSTSNGGIFFRPGFASSNYYNASILSYDHNSDTAKDGISINGYDGISFSTGSNTRNERVRIDGSGNVGIGTASPGFKTDINGRLRVTGADCCASSGIGVEILYNTGTGQGEIFAYDRGGNAGKPLAIQGTVYGYSDARLKTDIHDLDDAEGIDLIGKLHPVSFRWRDAKQDASEGRRVGLLAQDVRRVFPSIVRMSQMASATTVTSADGKKDIVHDVLSLDYEGLVVPLVKAVQTLKSDNDNLRAANDNQDAEIRELREEIDELKAKIH